MSGSSEVTSPTRSRSADKCLVLARDRDMVSSAYVPLDDREWLIDR